MSHFERVCVCRILKGGGYVCPILKVCVFDCVCPILKRGRELKCVCSILKGWGGELSYFVVVS